MAAGETTSEFRPLNELEQLLIEASTGDRTAQRAFESAVLDATIFAVTPHVTSANQGLHRVEVGDKLSFYVVSLSDGRSATALFTAFERIQPAFPAGAGYVGAQGSHLLAMIRSEPAILNPGQPNGVIWEPADLSAILGLPHRRVIDRPTKVQLGTPSEIPVELLDRLRHALEPNLEIEAAWLALARWPDTQSNTWFLDIRTNGDREPISQTVSDATHTLDLRDRPLDVTVNPTGGEDGIGLVVVRHR